MSSGAFTCTRWRPRASFARDVEALGAEFVPWRLNRGSVNPFTEAGSLVSLLRIYRRLRPDVAQHFTIKPNVYGALAAMLAGVPVVVGGVTGLGYAFAEGGRRRSVLRPLARLLYRLTAALSDGVTFQTAHDADVLFGASGRFRRSALVIQGGSGVDLAAFSEEVVSAKARREMRGALGDSTRRAGGDDGVALAVRQGRGGVRGGGAGGQGETA